MFVALWIITCLGLKWYLDRYYAGTEADRLIDSLRLSLDAGKVRTPR